MEGQDLKRFVEDFHSAIVERRRCPGPMAIGELTIAEAYEVQRSVIAIRIASGEHQVGYKVGCTSHPIRTQFGLSEPVIGALMMPHVRTDGVTFQLSDFVNCAVEPEMVFTIASDIDDDFLRNRDIKEAIASVSPGIEVHNYLFRYGRATAQELISSNAIHAALVVGDSLQSSESLKFDEERFDIFIDDNLAASGLGKAIMGGPLKSLRWLAETLIKRGTPLKAGDLVIPGSPVELIAVDKCGTITATLSTVGSVSAHFQ